LSIVRPLSDAVWWTAFGEFEVQQRVEQRDQRDHQKQPAYEATASDVATLDAALRIDWNVAVVALW